MVLISHSSGCTGQEWLSERDLVLNRRTWGPVWPDPPLIGVPFDRQSATLAAIRLAAVGRTRPIVHTADSCPATPDKCKMLVAAAAAVSDPVEVGYPAG
jgi:hypothetical protein